MATHTASLFLQRLRQAALLENDAGLSDGQLLERYLARRDESAFQSLVLRHGPMVLGVCRRILRNEADAEDAFQATFLVFVLKAASIRARGRLGSWLYGVAHNTARKAKAMSRARRAKEQEAGAATKDRRDEADAQDLQGLLDAELSGLPEMYRAAVVACDLEGKTIKEAACLLGWPPGTVATRLRRGRALLAKRLGGRGVVLPGGLAAVPASLVGSTVRAAMGVAAGEAVTGGLVSAQVAALVQGVLSAMLMTKLKTTVVVAVVFLGLGGSLLSQSRMGPTTPAPAGAQAKADDNLKNTLLALDRHLWEAFARGDWRERQKFLADDLVSISPLGKYGKADAAEADKRLRCGDWSIRDAEVARVSKDVAVLCYVYGCKILSADGKLLETRKDYRVTYVWANRKGGWVIVFCHDDHGRQPKDGIGGDVLNYFRRFQGAGGEGRVYSVPFLDTGAVQPQRGDPRAPDPLAERPALPVGEWDVEFTNGVTEKVFFSSDKTVKAVEKNRTAVGRATAKDEAIVVTYADDRVERWTRSGKRMAVEHWFPANRYPNGRPVLGIAERRDGAARLELVPLQHIRAADAAKALANIGGDGRVVTDDRTNSVLLYGSDEQLAKYRAKLREIDVPNPVEGLVRGVEGNLVKISLGSDAGLSTGQTLEVFRLGSNPAYIGRIKLVDVRARESVGQVMGRPMKAIEAGDRVASRIPSGKK
jgi:RNA polymerase sigma factor (sigma-70 family)